MSNSPTDYAGLLQAAASAAGLPLAEMAPPTDHYVSLNGIRIHYLDWGNSHLPHVVLLHGGSLQAHTFDLAALLLRDHYHLIVPSQRGHGDTSWTPDVDLDKDNGELMLEDTRQFIEHLGCEKLVLVGMSMGGMTTMRYAARHPTRLTAVGIVDVAPESMRAGLVEMEAFREETETLDSFEDFLKRSMKFMPHRAPEHLRYSLTHALKETEDGRYTWKQDHRRRLHNIDLTAEERRLVQDTRAEALWDDLRSIAQPTLLFRGAESKILSMEVAERVIREMQHAELVEIPRATHNVHSDNPVDFAAALDTFLGRHV